MKNQVKYSDLFLFDKDYNRFLILLLLVDLIFFCLHFLMINGILSGPMFAIDADMAFPEMYQYIKEFWIAVLLLFLAINKRHIIYVSWTILFTYLLIDDSFRIHERLGIFLAEYFEFNSFLGIRARDFGELFVSIFFIFLFFSFISISYFASGYLEKQISKNLFWLLTLLAFFGVFIDMIQSLFPTGEIILAFIEDGGEMIIMSFILWYVFWLDRIHYQKRIRTL